MTDWREGIVVLLLAAGYSRRFNGDKLQSVLPDGSNLLERSCARVRDSGLKGWVVMRPEAAATAVVLPRLDVPRAEEGMGGSIADAVAQLQEDWRACLILPADLPLLRVDTLIAVARAADAATIVLPQADGRRGHPVAFGRDFREALLALAGDSGGRSILREYPQAVRVLPVDDPGCYRDMDTREDYLRVIGKGAGGRGPGTK